MTITQTPDSARQVTQTEHGFAESEQAAPASVPTQTHPRYAGDTLSDSASVPMQTHPAHAESEQAGGSAVTDDPTQTLTSNADHVLSVIAGLVDDLEAVRKATGQRIGALERLGHTGADADTRALTALSEELGAFEKKAVRHLERSMKAHRFGPWVAARHGIGFKGVARLLAVIGDPYIDSRTGQPRTLSQLWSYCGHGDASRRPRKGMTQAEVFALGSPVAKMRLYLIAEPCMKARGYFRPVYDARKAATEGRRFTGCTKCPGDGPCRPAHRNADALRVTGKAILADLYDEAKRLHLSDSAVLAAQTHSLHAEPESASGGAS